MMTMKEITSWCYERSAMNMRYVFNYEGHYKMRFENGETYEWKSVDEGRYHHVTIILNGKVEHNALWEATWLDNGNFGNKLIKELPIEIEEVA